VSAEPAHLVVEHEPHPSPAVAVRLHPHDRAQNGLEQVEQVDALIAENAALGAPPADGSAGAMAAGDEPARATVRPDPPDLGAEEAAYFRGVPPGQPDLRGLGRRRMSPAHLLGVRSLRCHPLR